MTYSLHRRLILILLALTLATWLVAVVITALLAQQLIVRQVERQLVQYMDMAQHSVGLIFGTPELKRYYMQNAPEPYTREGQTRLQGFGTRGREQATNIWFESDQVVIGELAPAFPAPVHDGFITWHEPGEGGSVAWRVRYRQEPELGIWLAVGVDLDHATGIGTVTFLRAVLPLLVILPLTVGILLWGVRRGLQPLDRLAGSIEARQPQALDAIDSDDVPAEIRPVVVALNGLLDRLRRALESESRFTANAAHELQTPLAAIKAEVQRYQRQATDEESRNMLGRISARVSRATNTVTQLLTLARLDPEQEFQRMEVNLSDLVIDAIAEEGATAVERELDIRVPEDSPLRVTGHPGWLKILVRNLLANAFRYSPAGGVVDVSLHRQQDRVLLRIANDCEPIPEDQRRQLTDRFHTLAGNHAGGVGLGLSIVQRVAELHGAELRLEPWEEGRGFLAEVAFPSGLDTPSPLGDTPQRSPQRAAPGVQTP